MATADQCKARLRAEASAIERGRPHEIERERKRELRKRVVAVQSWDEFWARFGHFCSITENSIYVSISTALCVLGPNVTDV